MVNETDREYPADNAGWEEGTSHQKAGDEEEPYEGDDYEARAVEQPVWGAEDAAKGDEDRQDGDEVGLVDAPAEDQAWGDDDEGKNPQEEGGDYEGEEDYEAKPVAAAQDWEEDEEATKKRARDGEEDEEHDNYNDDDEDDETKRRKTD